MMELKSMKRKLVPVGGLVPTHRGFFFRRSANKVGTPILFNISCCNIIF